ncbi:hypothetical protein CCR80_02350 [Rhodothalassium salexigens]|uniref:GNAT family N-acetyltransferase n=1 Tax=Rhodothalassium salexigens TaxID=1086 RepID=UPI001914B9D9|nr:GNAT family N-acetyltransferase [Rhodothalassium salexigens]MBK5919877.1 hypothetical protein [Rhodothalassium salexigens]
MQADGIFSAQPEHMAIVVRLFRDYQAELGIDLCFQGFAAELAGLPGVYAPPAGALLLAWAGGEAVGVVGLKPLDPPEVAEMKRLYVVPSARGAGVAEALCLRIEGVAWLAGYRRLKLDTLARLDAANRLYQRLGYRPTAPYSYNPEADIRYFEKAL